METSQILGLLVNGILSAAAVIGAVVAVRGLSAWRKQLKGSEEYGLARRVLVDTYKLREAIRRVRNPAIWAHEMPQPPKDEAEKMTADEVNFWGVSKAYQGRWDGVAEVEEVLFADLLEAEAVWGTDLMKKFGEIFKLKRELWYCVYAYLNSTDPRLSEKMREAYDRILSKEREILYGNPKTDDGDDFTTDLRNAIGPIEAFLKPKLGK